MFEDIAEVSIGMALNWIAGIHRFRAWRSPAQCLKSGKQCGNRAVIHKMRILSGLAVSISLKRTKTQGA